MALIIKATATSMNPTITTPTTSPVCETCFPHSESVESFPGLISSSPIDSHLKGEGPDNRFSFRVFHAYQDSRLGVNVLGLIPNNHNLPVGLQVGS